MLNARQTGSAVLGSGSGNGNTAVLSPDGGAQGANGSTPAQTTTPPAATPTTTSTGDAATQITSVPTQSTTIATAAASAVSDATAKATAHASNNQGNNVNIGPVVGGTIGGLVLGLAAGVLLMLIWSRRKRRSGKNAKQYSAMSTFEKGPHHAATEISGDESTPYTAWLVHLPQPADDSTLRHKAKTLLQQIDLHVENFYSDASPTSQLDSNALSAVQYYDTNLLLSSLATLLSTSKSKKALIKHCLAHLILSKTDFNNPGSHSILPPELTSLPAILAQQSANGGPSKTQKVYSEAYAQWRVLTAYLRSPTPTAPTPQQDSAITSTAEHFADAFAPWAATSPSSSSSSPNSRKASLATILKSAIEVGTLFFAQPSRLEFRWAAAGRERRSGGEIETAPALLKVTDEVGRVLARPQVLVEGSVVREGRH